LFVVISLKRRTCSKTAVIIRPLDIKQTEEWLFVIVCVATRISDVLLTFLPGDVDLVVLHLNLRLLTSGASLGDKTCIYIRQRELSSQIPTLLEKKVPSRTLKGFFGCPQRRTPFGFHVEPFLQRFIQGTKQVSPMGSAEEPFYNLFSKSLHILYIITVW
jgi:hypothetical protein